MPVTPLTRPPQPQSSVAATHRCRLHRNNCARLPQRALRIGLLVRGGATIGKLFDGNGIVFGEAMMEAYHIETRIATYPRVVLSRKITERHDWIKGDLFVRRVLNGLLLRRTTDQDQVRLQRTRGMRAVVLKCLWHVPLHWLGRIEACLSLNISRPCSVFCRCEFQYGRGRNQGRRPQHSPGRSCAKVRPPSANYPSLLHG